MEKIINGKDLVNMQFIETEDGLLKRYEKKGRFVPEIGQAYWFIKENGCIGGYTNDQHEIDNWILKHNLVFETIEEVEEYKNYLIALDKYSYDFSQEELENREIIKYYLYFDYVDKSISVGSCFCIKSSDFQFRSKDIEKFINEVGKEAIERYMFGYYR